MELDILLANVIGVANVVGRTHTFITFTLWLTHGIDPWNQTRHTLCQQSKSKVIWTVSRYWEVIVKNMVTLLLDRWHWQFCKACHVSFSIDGTCAGLAPTRHTSIKAKRHSKDSLFKKEEYQQVQTRTFIWSFTNAIYPRKQRFRLWSISCSNQLDQIAISWEMFRIVLVRDEEIKPNFRTKTNDGTRILQVFHNTCSVSSPKRDISFW